MWTVKYRVNHCRIGRITIVEIYALQDTPCVNHIVNDKSSSFRPTARRNSPNNLLSIGWFYLPTSWKCSLTKIHRILLHHDCSWIPIPTSNQKWMKTTNIKILFYIFKSAERGQTFKISILWAYNMCLCVLKLFILFLIIIIYTSYTEWTLNNKRK